MAPLPTLYVRQSLAPGPDPSEEQGLLALPEESAAHHPYALKPRQYRHIVGLSEATLPEPSYSWTTGGPGSSSGRPYQPPSSGPRPEAMHNPAVDLTPGSVPMGEVGPPGSSFFEDNKSYFMIGGVVVVLAVGGWFGFNWWKKKKAAG